MHTNTLISIAELTQLQASQADLIILDCRFSLLQPDAGWQAFNKGHIAGAQYAHLELDLSSAITSGSGRHPLPGYADFQARLQGWGIAATTQVVAYDDVNGAIAARLWWLMQLAGHHRVALLDGGLQAWQDYAGPMTSGHYQPTASQTCASNAEIWPNQQWCITSAAVMNNIEQSRFILVDARCQNRFNGQDEAIDPVAGHVPKAINRPFENNLVAGHFKNVTQLRKEWLYVSDCPVQQQPRALVHMCGSGVTACFNALAMTHAGLDGMSVYVGSWSEWITDSQRPLSSMSCSLS